MIKKERIFELKITDEEDESGVDSISLVDTPAIEYNWVSFRKECPDGCALHQHSTEEHEFEHDYRFVEILEKIGDLEEDYINEGWIVDSMEVMDGKTNFFTTDPNAPSSADTEEYRVRYKYILNPEISGPDLLPTSRPFCQEMMRRNMVWRIEDMESATNDFGQSPLEYRGSFNCRHMWARIKYRNEGNIKNKASANESKTLVDGRPNDAGAPDLRVQGDTQPITITDKTLIAVDNGTAAPRTAAHLGLSKQFSFDGEKVSIDYDDTLSTDRGKALAKRLISEGKDVYIITRRREESLGPVKQVAKQLGIDERKIHATNGKLKWETIKRLGIQTHYDNNPDELKAIKVHAPAVRAIQFDYAVGSIGGYVDPGLKKKPIQKSLLANTMTCENCGWEWEIKDGGEDPYICHKCGYDNSPNKNSFASHSDYPDSVKHNAQAVLKYIEENGWGSCGTPVGKQRANQLAKGEPISEDTIRRMYSYLSRHEGDLDSSKGYGDGCGKLMYDSWGGKSALSWAKSKINTFDKQNFSIGDEEKRVVLGPCMVPNERIFRKGEDGQPYYVYFSPETIRMIAEKYMRNQYTRNNDLMHNGKAVKDIYVIESWIKESMDDKSSKYGYGALPVGSWFVSMKIPKTPAGDKVWAQVKNGTLNGFSVSGYFDEIAKFTKEDMFLHKLSELLSKE